MKPVTYSTDIYFFKIRKRNYILSHQRYEKYNRYYLSIVTIKMRLNKYKFNQKI